MAGSGVTKKEFELPGLNIPVKGGIDGGPPSAPLSHRKAPASVRRPIGPITPKLDADQRNEHLGAKQRGRAKVRSLGQASART